MMAAVEESKRCAPQTLIMRSREPETMVLPSGEKVTELMSQLCALSLLALSSKVPVKRVEAALAGHLGRLWRLATAYWRPRL